MIIINGEALTHKQILGGPRRVCGAIREAIEMQITGSEHAALAALFVNGASFAVRQMEQQQGETGPVLDEEGKPVLTPVDYDKSEYCVAGEIVDHRDGTFTVYMGKPTAAERERDEKDQLMLELLTERGAII